ncbi:hypothetical protein J4Q44_G00378560 [Coregonus suidteri]|uniref:Uncharacterized protein n=1 Tax=Coregonus suidteri TaxID=861788 RepID=A0AAN8QA20_9TELE
MLPTSPLPSRLRARSCTLSSHRQEQCVREKEQAPTLLLTIYSLGACIWNKKALLFLTGEKEDTTHLDFLRNFIWMLCYRGV